MFYYYGRKKQIARFYPKPQYNTIIEPFAGSAAYSLFDKNWENTVLLFDTNKWCIDIWLYLKQASKSDILNLPDIECGQSLESLQQLSTQEKNLIGVHINPGSSSPKLTATKASRWKAGKKYISENIHKIKHWDIKQADYSQAPNIKATWFIDPPYQKAGVHYCGKQPDYTKLGIWVQNLKGQIIACEGEGATWLPFIPLTIINNGGLNKAKRKKELLFIKDSLRDED